MNSKILNEDRISITAFASCLRLWHNWALHCCSSWRQYSTSRKTMWLATITLSLQLKRPGLEALHTVLSGSLSSGVGSLCQPPHPDSAPSSPEVTLLPGDLHKMQVWSGHTSTWSSQLLLSVGRVEQLGSLRGDSASKFTLFESLGFSIKIDHQHF